MHNRSYGITFSQVMPIHPGIADPIIVKILKPVLSSSCEGVSLNKILKNSFRLNNLLILIVGA
jgi:hypothetical protein